MARVLIVDDEAPYREYLSAQMHRDGHQVATASGSREALDLAKDFQPEFLIVDWVLPGSRSGIDVYEVLLGAFPALQALLITGFAASDLAEQARRASISGILEKPFSLIEFSGRVRAMIAGAA